MPIRRWTVAAAFIRIIALNQLGILGTFTGSTANPGTIPLEIIEVQSGSYLGEDEIVRFEDNYGRSK